jgi:transposase
MDTSNPVAIEAVSSRQAVSPIKRQHRSPELKRQIVEETLAPGASVARVARAHGVNANQVFAWRRRYQQGLLTPAKRARPGLLAVRVTEAGVGLGDVQSQSPRTVSGMIQVELPKGKLCLTGCVDGEALRVVLEALRG